MDSEHRHELEQNDLLEFITHFREWWVKNGLKTLLMILAVTVGLFLYVMQKQKAKDAHDTGWGDYYSASSPESLRQVAKAHDIAGIQIHSYLRAADLALAKARGEGQFIEMEGQTTTLSDTEREELLASADQDYRHARDHENAHTAVRLNAMLGMAAVAESRRDWDKARDLYQLVQHQGKDRYEVIVAEAKARESALDGAAVPVVFAPPEPEPQAEATSTETPATQPAESGG